MPLYGLIGRSLTHSFSEGYFSKKFLANRLTDHAYRLYELESISELPALIKQTPDLMGLNVTIPYKTEVLVYVQNADAAASAIGAANTLKISRVKGNQVIKAYNTDWIGFTDSIKQTLPILPSKVLILGTGGAARAVAYALSQMHIKYTFISRQNKGRDIIPYKALNSEIMSDHDLIVNATPLGMYPDIDSYPDIPYEYLTHKHFLYDLVYNPPITEFLKKGQQQNAYICNGLKMLYAQAEHSWKIWQDENL